MTADYLHSLRHICFCLCAKSKYATLNEKSINSIIQNFLMKKEEFPIPINLDEKIKNFVERSTELNVQSWYGISDLKLLLEKINCD